MSFSEKLRQFRKQKNLTQENLANEILVSRTLITKYESGAVYPTEENLKRLADYFKVATSELMPEEERISATVKSSLKPLWISLTAVALIISLTLLLLLVIPIFSYGNEFTSSSLYVYGTINLLSAYFKVKNPLAIISFILCLLNSGYTTVLLFGNFKHEKILRIAEGVAFGLTVCLFIITLVVGIGIIGSDTFHMNGRR
ncbi:MAG: helix-turn-helix domain-containing protein [Clostridia bacterium]|nr:helix-turn-helix domain-containing protein [Clostridia bacterium]